MRSRIVRRTPLLLVVGLAALIIPLVTFAEDPWNQKTNFIRDSIKNGRADNVIFFLGDGMGDSEITIARNYHVGADGRLSLDKLPLTGEVTTYAVQESNPALPEYVTDSAASGTSWATGVKTSNGRISTTASTDQDLTTILELAQQRGLRTGDVSTAELTDATPAVLASHVNARGCQGPADMSACLQDKKSAGGPGSIAEQEVDHHVDVLLGGGKQRFDQLIDGGPYAGKTVIESAMLQGYQVVTTTEQLADVHSSKKVLGLFNKGNMSLNWSGALAQPYPGSGPQRCLEDQRPANEPSLADMTRKAISLLENKRGFFLQVEGASIDKQDHAANPCGQIGETIAFDEAVKVGLEYQKTHPRTLVIVTADHGHTSQIIEAPTSSTQPGAFSTLITADNANMVVSYASAPVGQSQSHTGTEVRVAAQGPGAANVVGIINQTDLFAIMRHQMKLDSDSR